MNRNRRLCRLIMLCIVCSLCAVCLSFQASAASGDGVVITETVNIAQAKMNVEGHGYSWANRFDILTLNGLRIETESPYGLRLPKNCTVVLQGDNYIKASRYALSCAGTVTFKGSGSLTLEAGDIGIYLFTEDGTQKVRLLEGTYTVHAGTYGVYSVASDFSLVDGSMDITVDSPDGAAISGRIVNLVGGKLKANNAVDAAHILNVQGLDLDIRAPRAAFSAPTLSVAEVTMTSDGAEIGEYSGQTQISGVSASPLFGPSIIFGESVPSYVDYICLAVLVTGIAAAVVGPVLHHKKKARALLARLETENPDAAAVLKR